MYKLNYYTEDDNERIMAFIKENSFAIITGFDKEYPVATHVPLDVCLADGKLIFTGHIMKSTDHHKALLKNENVLVIFHGPHTYVSASWYTKPDVASTWNYITVHAKGKIKFGDETDTRRIIKNITNKYESDGSAAAFEKLPEEYVKRLVKAIIGFTIEVDSMDNVFKLSQNHDLETRSNIIQHLEQSTDSNALAIASEMKQRIQLPKQTI